MEERATRSALELATEIEAGTYAKGDVKHIVDALIEPMWTGLRVIAGVDRGRAVLVDRGEPLDDRPQIAAALATQVGDRADGLVLDGWLTRQIVSDDPVGSELVELPTAREFLIRGMVGSRSNPTKDATKRITAEIEARTFAPDEVVNLVAIDLLWLDGESLLDVPLLERKRLLDAILPAGDLVRPSLYVRPPVDPWLGSWRMQGFTGITYKAANSRYRPGEPNAEWGTAPMPDR